MKTVVLFFLLISTVSFSQVDGKIFFRNGKTFEGKIDVTFAQVDVEGGETKVHYFPTKDTRITKGFIDIDKVETYTENRKDTITHYFKKNKANNKEVYIKKLHTYKDFDVYMDSYYEDRGGYTMHMNEIFSSMTEEYVRVDVYYLAKKYSVTLEKLHKRQTSKKFKSLLLQYAGRCQNIEDIINKYQKNKKLEKSELFKELDVACN